MLHLQQYFKRGTNTDYMVQMRNYREKAKCRAYMRKGSGTNINLLVQEELIIPGWFPECIIYDTWSYHWAERKGRQTQVNVDSLKLYSPKMDKERPTEENLRPELWKSRVRTS